MESPLSPCNDITGGDYLKVEFIKRVGDEIDLLHRHIRILVEIMKDEKKKEREGQTPGIGIMKLSKNLKIPDHKVRYSLRVLEHEGLIVPTAHGAVSTPKAKESMEDIKNSLMIISQKIGDLINYIEEVSKKV